MTMIVHDVQQGTNQWHSLRAEHFTASEAPAMMGVSPYLSRDELLKQKALRLVDAEIDSHKAALFQAGHDAEAGYRPIAEAQIDDDLYNITGTRDVDGLPLLASFDGLTMDRTIGFEHKLWSGTVSAQLADAGEPAPHHYWQLEQQLLVSGAQRIMFATSDGTAERSAWVWYESKPERRAQLIAGWKQFAADLAAWVAPGAAPQKVVAEPVEALPAPVVQVSGQITLCDNFKVFEQRLRDFLDNKLIRNPKTDEDFVNLDAQIKAMKSGREALKGARAQMLAQVQPVDQADKVAEMLDSLLQQNCSMAERLLKDEKERRRSDIVLGGKAAFAAHVGDLNREIAPIKLRLPEPDFGGGIRGLKSLASMEAKVSSELAQAKVHANEIARETRARLAWFAEAAKGYEFLFPDLQEIIFL